RCLRFQFTCRYLSYQIPAVSLSVVISEWRSRPRVAPTMGLRNAATTGVSTRRGLSNTCYLLHAVWADHPVRQEMRMNASNSLTMTGGEALVRTLKAFKVDHVFGLPGNQLRFYDALARGVSIRHVLVRREQAAAHMADGYARITSRVGVCDASAGPGSTNLVTGLGESYASGIPVVALATTTRSFVSGRANFQELDLERVFSAVTKRVLSLDHAARVPEMVKRAFRIAASGKPGPVAVVVPADVHAETASFDASVFEVQGNEGMWPARRIAPTDDDVGGAIELLGQSERPLIWAGGG